MQIPYHFAFMLLPVAGSAEAQAGSAAAGTRPRDHPGGAVYGYMGLHGAARMRRRADMYSSLMLCCVHHAARAQHASHGTPNIRR